jgi:hypothetical protein
MEAGCEGRKPPPLFLGGEFMNYSSFFVYARLDLSACWLAKSRPVFVLFTPPYQSPSSSQMNTLSSSPSAITCHISDSNDFCLAMTWVESIF